MCIPILKCQNKDCVYHNFVILSPVSAKFIIELLNCVLGPPNLGDPPPPYPLVFHLTFKSTVTKSLCRCHYISKVKGLDGTIQKGQCAFVFTLNHALIDGMSCIGLLKKFYSILNSIMKGRLALCLFL